MLFSSAVFLFIFLPVVLFLYYVCFRKNRLLQNVMLLLASLLFYAWGEPKTVFLMIISIFVNWLLGRMISLKRNKGKMGRLFLVIAIVYNLGILFVFKYLIFVNSLFGSPIRLPEIALPIGISFFTFQAMSYVIDVYREKAAVQNNILNVGLYISFFPQLIAGPIVRYETIALEIAGRKESTEDFFEGFGRFVIGLGKKVLLANYFALVADAAFSSIGNLSVAFSWLGALAYTFQIYFDFSGYSDMAIGLGRMFGFHFQENFNYPYISDSITDFWRRWHISLGTWFRDYLYIPLGGNREGKLKTTRNLFLVWLLTGIWHGANFTFIIWGLMYFMLLFMEKILSLDSMKNCIPLKRVYTLLFVILGWVIFRAESVSDAVRYLGAMSGIKAAGLSDGLFLGYFKQNIVLLCIGIVGCSPVVLKLKKLFKKKSLSQAFQAAALIVILVLSVSSIISSSYNPFIYFNF